MSRPCFLSLDQVLRLQAELIEVYGGAAGIRDQGLRQSAVSMPQAAFGGQDLHPTLFDLPPHLILEEYDFDHSADEDRIRSIGPVERGVILVVSTERDDGAVIRLISARLATPQERRRYADMIAGV